MSLYHEVSVESRENSPHRSAILHSSSSLKSQNISRDVRLQRSQQNIEKKQKDDFERLQEQIKRRAEREEAAKEIAQYYRD